MLDKANTFADKSNLPTAAAKNLWGDVYKVKSDVGQGHPVYVSVVITTALASAGGTTTKFRVVTDDREAIRRDGNEVVIGESAAIAKANLTAGTQVNIPIAAGNISKGYIGVQVENVGAVLTAGAGTATLLTGAQFHNPIETYPDAV